MISAALAAAAQHSPVLPWLAAFAFVPLFLGVRGRGFLASWAAFVLFFTAHAVLANYWLLTAGTAFAQLLLVEIGVLALGAAIPAGLYYLARGSVFSLPAGFMLAEVAARLVLPGASFPVAGAPLADYAPIAQLAAAAGPELLTFFAAGMSAALALPSRKMLVPVLVQGPCLLILVLVWGNVRLAAPVPKHHTLRAGVIQPPLSQGSGKAGRSALLTQTRGLMEQALSRFPALLVLPESALPGPVRFDPEMAGMIEQIVNRDHTSVVFGSYDIEGKAIYPAGFLASVTGSVSAYQKIHSVPFVQKSSYPVRFGPQPKGTVLSSGSEYTVFYFHGVFPFSTLLGQEDTLPDVTSRFRSEGAQLLIALVDSQRFLGTSEARQHLRSARLAAIAAGLPMIRAANAAGISALIDSRGRILARIPEGQPGAEIFSVPLASANSFYAEVGDPGAISAALVLLALIIGRARSIIVMPAPVIAVYAKLMNKRRRRSFSKRKVAEAEVKKKRRFDHRVEHQDH